MKFKREHRLKVISFLIATTLWYFVVWGKPIEKTIEIPIVYKPFNPNYLIEINPSNVALKIKAIRRVLRNFPEKELKVEIDVSKYFPGIYRIRIPVEKINLPPTIQIKEVNPNFVTVIIKKISTKKIPVKPIFADVKILKYSKFKLKIVPSYVKVRAPIDILSSTKVIYTEPINLLKLKITKKMMVNVMPPVGSISVIPEKVKVIYQEE